jgi:hypothetical protein
LSLREKLTTHVHNVYMNNLIYYRAPNLGMSANLVVTMRLFDCADYVL